VSKENVIADVWRAAAAHQCTMPWQPVCTSTGAIDLTSKDTPDEKKTYKTYVNTKQQPQTFGHDMYLRFQLINTHIC
jgi:hypothetical protein